MKIWRQATGAIKDKFSLIAAADDKLTAEIIKATSHNDPSMDIENVQFIYRYIQCNPSSFKPIIRAISSRVESTRSWTVALKSLMLIHGLFLAGHPTVESIGRLPFDLSGFGKTNSRFSKTGRFSIFIRAYFAFLDGRSVLFFNDGNRPNNEIVIRLETIAEMQRIVDSLMRIKPIGETMETPLVIEAMGYVISEIMEIYGRICRGFDDFLSDFLQSRSGKPEAELAKKIVAKSSSQGEEVFKYFEFCRVLGIANDREIPYFLRVSESDVVVLDSVAGGNGGEGFGD
uniref:Clathrin assembly protein-related protein n=1 Tax=Schrenkiella parvula TaxID=98039 RepID=E5F6Z8_9BRAS|nr:clathrin assembly protein-related protein [Schrenkiella parvula]